MRKYFDADFERLQELYDQGLSDLAIEKQMGISHSVVGRWRKSKGLESNYVKRIGLPYGNATKLNRHNFEGVFDHNKHMQEWFAKEGAFTTAEKEAAIRKRARQVLEAMKGGEYEIQRIGI